MATTVVNSALQSTAGAVKRAPREWAHKPYLRLTNVPRSALPADIRRACVKANFDHFATISLDYFRFLPTTRAYIQLSNPTVSHTAEKALQNAIVGGNQIHAVPSNAPTGHRPIRSRGVKGRAEAAERGIVTGSGLDAGVARPGCNVVLWGLPGKMTPGAVRQFLKGYKLAGTQGGAQEVVKLELPSQRPTFSSRHFVRLASVTEAHRLVRTLHMTYYKADLYEFRYPIHARVIY